MKGSASEPFKIRPKTKKRTCISASSYGADGRIRTGDLILTEDALYRLSYISTSPFLDARLIILHLPSKSKGIFKVYCNFTMDAGKERPEGTVGSWGRSRCASMKEADCHGDGSGQQELPGGLSCRLEGAQ